MTMPLGKDLSYLPLLNTVFGDTIRDVPLVTDTRVPLPPRRSPKRQTMERPVLVDEDDTKEAEVEGVRALKRTRKQEVPAPPVDIEPSEGTQSMVLLGFQ